MRQTSSELENASQHNEHAARVSNMFDRIAGWYDFLNHLLSLGQDIYWRHQLVSAVRPKTTGRVLDLAAGTLDVSLEILRQHPELSVLSMDFSLAMLLQGKTKIKPTQQNRVCLTMADGRSLPLASNSVDCVTIAFGIRNILPREAAFKECLRVLCPGGRLCVLEFGTGHRRIWQGAYNFYLTKALPAIGSVVSGDATAYQYLADSILAFPSEEKLAQEMMGAGFDKVFYRPMASGIVYLHVAQKKE